MAKNETKIEITAEDRTAPAFTSLSNRLLGVEQGFGKISGLIGGISAITAVGFLTQSVKSAADFSDEVGDLAQTLGTTTERLSALKYAADIEGVFEPLQAGMTKLAKASEDFRSGSTGAIESFGKLKIDPSSFKDTSELFAVVADKLSKMEDGARKTAIAQELLGRSGAQLLPLINQGADGLSRYADEAQRFGLIVSEEVAAAAGEYNDNLSRISAAGKGLSVTLGNALLPALSEIAENFVINTREANLFVAALAAIGNAGKIAISGTDSGADQRRYYEILEEKAILQKNINRLEKTGENSSLLNNLKKDLTPLNKELDGVIGRLASINSSKFEKQESKISQAFEPAIKPVKSKTSSGKSDVEKYAEEMATLIKSFDEAVKPAQTVSEKLQEQLDIYTDIDPAIRSYAESLIAQSKAQENAIISAEDLNLSIERNNEMMSALQVDDDATQSLYKANSETYDAILREAEDLTVSLIENDKERARKQLEIENRRRLERIDLMEGEADQIAAIREAELERQDAAFKALEKQTSQSSNIGRDLGLTFSSAFEDSIVKGKEFSEVLQGIGEDIIRILARKTVTEPLAEAFSGGFGSGLGDWFKSIIPNANGGVYNSPSLSAFSGSVVSSPTMFAFANGAGLMGEAGAEGIFPLKRGKDGKLGVEASGAGAGNVEYNVQVSVDATGGSVQGNNEKANDLGRQIAAAVRSVLLSEKKQGGLLA
jgi:hypothetical protein